MRDPSPNSAPAAAPTDSPSTAPGITVRSVVLFLILAVISLAWIRQASLIDFTCLVGEGTPALPAVVAITLLGAVAPWIKRACRRLALTKAETLAIYFSLTIVAPISCANIVRQLLPTLTALPYFASPENHFAQFAHDLPSWLAPHRPDLILGFFEGSSTGAVPWGGWAVPMLVWGGVIFLYTATMLCWVTLFREQWTRNERLSYPLVELAVHLIDTDNAIPADRASRGSLKMPPLLRSPLFWCGFAVSALFNLSNIAHVFNPNLAAIGSQFDFGALLTDKPWSGLRPLPLYFRPEVVGIAYFAPQEACFSVWFFYLLLRFEKFFAEMLGWQLPGMPFEAAQAEGAYLALALCLIYAARHHLRAAAASALGCGRTGAEAREPLSYRLAFLGGIAGTIGFAAFLVAAGVRTWVAGLFTLVMFATPLVYSRMRAEMGIPMSYAWPIGQWTRGFYQVFGSKLLAGGEGMRPLVALTTVGVFDRMAVQNFMACELEAMKAEELVAARKRDLAVWAIFLGLAVGIAGGYVTHLTAFYKFGSNILDGGVISGGYRTQQAVSTFQALNQIVTTPQLANPQHTAFMGLGFATICVLTVMRQIFLRFPLSPLGFAVAAAYGHVPWFGFFTAWALKAVIQRLGGAQLRIRMAPAFFGLAMGHYLVGGALWGILGMFTPKAKEYIVWFC